jgi:hypothetical protein
MVTKEIPPQELIRKAVIEVAQLPENELLVVIEILGELKKQRIRSNRMVATEIVQGAKSRALNTSSLARKDLMKQFGETIAEIRSEAIEKGVAIEGEIEGD